MNQFLVENSWLVACGMFCLWPLLWAVGAWWFRGMVERRGLPRLQWGNGTNIGGEDDDE